MRQFCRYSISASPLCSSRLASCTTTSSSSSHHHRSISSNLLCTTTATLVTVQQIHFVCCAKRFCSTSSSSSNSNNDNNNNNNNNNSSNTHDKNNRNSSTSSSSSSSSSLSTTTASNNKKDVAATGDKKKDVTGKKYWFSDIERKITPHDPAMEIVRDILLNPMDPKAPQPGNVAPIPQVGENPPGGLMVQGPHELAPAPFIASPLMLAEEVIKPPQVLSEMELLMKAWSEEFARAYFIFTVTMRFLIVCVSCFLLYFYYRSVIRIERIRRGTDNQPKNLRVGCVVYFDMEEDGRPLGRIVIGLLNESCPLYCEYFHRRCTGNGGNGETFRGMKLKCMAPNSAVIFGDGKNMTHDVPGYNPRYLPTEWVAPGPWRGACMSIPYAANQESPNFAMLLNAGDFKPNTFGIVMAGFDVLEKMSRGGISHACDPRHDYVIEGCGELCTLEKSDVQPMPWRLYETVSKGYDPEKFGPKSDWSALIKALELGQGKQPTSPWLGGLFAPQKVNKELYPPPDPPRGSPVVQNQPSQ